MDNRRLAGGLSRTCFSKAKKYELEARSFPEI